MTILNKKLLSEIAANVSPAFLSLTSCTLNAANLIAPAFQANTNLQELSLNSLLSFDMVRIFQGLKANANNGLTKLSATSCMIPCMQEYLIHANCKLTHFSLLDEDLPPQVLAKFIEHVAASRLNYLALTTVPGNIEGALEELKKSQLRELCLGDASKAISFSGNIIVGNRSLVVKLYGVSAEQAERTRAIIERMNGPATPDSMPDLENASVQSTDSDMSDADTEIVTPNPQSRFHGAFFSYPWKINVAPEDALFISQTAPYTL